MNTSCYWVICFSPVRAEAGEPVLSFANYIEALALFVVLFTTVDYRFKFRIQTAPGRLYAKSFWVVSIVGVLLLIADIWVSHGWYAPVTSGLDAQLFRGVLGLLLFAVLVSWLWYAFVRPPRFGRSNAELYLQCAYRIVTANRGIELEVLAGEIERSADSIVSHAASARPLSDGSDTSLTAESLADRAAHELLLLIGHRAFCRWVVQSSPNLAMALFDAAEARSLRSVPLGQFARNLTSEAIKDRASFIYVETHGRDTGLVGYIKPISKSVYGSYELVEAITASGVCPFDVDYLEMRRWDRECWEGYGRICLIMIDGWTVARARGSSLALRLALSKFEDSFIGLAALGEDRGDHTSDAIDRARVFMSFLANVLDLLEGHRVSFKLRLREDERYKFESIYDQLADLTYKLCREASYVSDSSMRSWEVQHNLIWSKIFWQRAKRGTPWWILQQKVKRLLYDEIRRLDSFVNYEGARILGYCLNVMGVDLGSRGRSSDRGQYSLQRVVLRWTKSNYLRLRSANLDVAEAVLVGTLSYDDVNRRLVKTYIKGLRRAAPQRFLQIEG